MLIGASIFFIRVAFRGLKWSYECTVWGKIGCTAIK